MAQHDDRGTTARTPWWTELSVREARSAFVKAFRTARRHPRGSAVREASARELAAAVRKAVLHGPLVVRLGPDGPILPGAAATMGAPPAGTADLVLVDADPEALEHLVDEWACQADRIRREPA